MFIKKEHWKEQKNQLIKEVQLRKEYQEMSSQNLRECQLLRQRVTMLENELEIASKNYILFITEILAKSESVAEVKEIGDKLISEIERITESGLNDSWM